MPKFFTYLETILEGLIIGGVTGAATSLKTGNFNWKQVGLASAVGAAAGVANAVRPRTQSSDNSESN